MNHSSRLRPYGIGSNYGAYNDHVTPPRSGLRSLSYPSVGVGRGRNYLSLPSSHALGLLPYHDAGISYGKSVSWHHGFNGTAAATDLSMQANPERQTILTWAIAPGAPDDDYLSSLKLKGDYKRGKSLEASVAGPRNQVLSP